ncbi:MAG: DUF6485 family protein [Candidatus Woesearchaeota archaeon]|nr:DUF6485 family protein [Candidatus Woesearchaeota archaeon]
MECKKESNLNWCTCTYPGCPRKGLCCECVRHHAAKRQIPACFFSKQAEKMYDRSFGKFVETTKI